MNPRVRSMVHWLSSHQGSLLVGILLIMSLCWGFAEIADEVLEGDTQTFDEWAVRSLRRANNLAVPIGPTWLHEIGRDMTALGGVAVLSLMTAGVAGYLAISRKYHAMWLVLGSTTGAVIISLALKQLFERPRPSIVPHLSIVHTSSFPSGHSMLSAAVYLTLGTLLARLVPQRGLKLYFIAIAFLLTALVGISRVYMGVHYPTDVLAGWTAGLAWALLCWTVARVLQMRGAVERDVDEPDADLKATREPHPSMGGGSDRPVQHPATRPLH
jgi:undecaprenyl-diphosphatase